MFKVKKKDLDYIQFEYKQPMPRESRGVDWLDHGVKTVVMCGHGTYGEAVPWH